MKRWWIYQRERFPLLAHGPLILAFSASAVSYSALLRSPQSESSPVAVGPALAAAPGHIAQQKSLESGLQAVRDPVAISSDGLKAGLQTLSPKLALRYETASRAGPSVISFAVAFFVSLGSFLLLRIADEFKDQEEDATYRPYRPVPRGLVKLRELAWIGVGVALLQLVLALVIGWALVGLLAVTWIYFALMSREFFARKWLKARPIVYLFSHMAIMPLVDWFATGCDWVHAGQTMPRGLFWFLAASFCNGIVIELGRKIRSPDREEAGVETYSSLWGPHAAVLAWLAATIATLACAGIAAQRIGFAAPVLATLGVCLGAAAFVGVAFLRAPARKTSKRIEALSGVWTLSLYLVLGVIPLWIKT